MAVLVQMKNEVLSENVIITARESKAYSIIVGTGRIVLS